MRKRDHGVLTNAASLLICGLLAGVVVAAAAFPVVAMSGLAAKASADAFDNLPSTLDVVPPPQISYVYASDGKTLLAMLYDENRRNVGIDDIAPVMQQAIVSAEDTRFYEHHGVDMKGVARAMVANHNSGDQVSQGASTLTMQYVRQALAYSARTNEEIVAATEQTPARKLREMKFALALEKKYNKKEILDRYLNISSFGHGAYGIYAASEVYFGKDPKNLTLPEAALLAGLVKAPSAFDPAAGDPAKAAAALQRREYVLRQMVTMHYITQQQADEAKKAPLKIVGQRPSSGCIQSPQPQLAAGFFCDYLYRWWLANPAFGADPYERENKLKSGGYKIISSLDITTQTAMKKNIEAEVPTGKSEALLEVGVQPGTGRVTAMATNRNFSNDASGNPLSTDPAKRHYKVKANYPNTTIPLMAGGDGIYGYQAGSTYKMFTMTAALEHGMTLDYTYDAPATFKSKYVIAYGGDATCPGTYYYCPVNDTPDEAGVYNMWTGFGHSINTYFVPLEQKVGAENAVDVAKRLGLQFGSHGSDPQHAGDYERAHNTDLAHGWGAFTLGVAQATPLELANAYATMANDGTYCAPTPVTAIVDPNGNDLEAAKPQCHQVVDPNVARAAVDAARCPVGDQSAFHECTGGTASGVHGVVKRPVAGKTGTTEGNRNAALVAMTKQLAIGAIMTDPDWQNNPEHMSHPAVNTSVADTLRDASVGKPVVDFTAPTKEEAYGQRSRIPSVHCKSVEAATSILNKAGFQVSQDTSTTSSNCPVHTVVRTDPSGETTSNGVVSLVLSSGPGDSPSPDPGQGGGGGTGGGPGGPPPPPGRGPAPLPTDDPRCKLFPWLCRPR